MGECFAHGRYMGGGMCPRCSELGAKGELLGYKKRAKKIPFRYDEKGRCRWCGGKVKKPRRSWCSQTCVDDYMVRNDPGLARRKVEERDAGVCALCKVDTLELRHRVKLIHKLALSIRFDSRPHKEIRELPPEEQLRMSWEREGRLAASIYVANEAAAIMRAAGFDIPNLSALDPIMRVDALITGHGHLWEMDHTVPVIDGGWGCGLENLRTLCLPCHKSESARLAAYRARKRAEVAAAEQERIAPRLPYID